MAKEAFKAAIAAKIKGQGNQIDLSGALASALNELADAALPIEVEDITKLTDEQLDGLYVGAQSHCFQPEKRQDGQECAEEERRCEDRD